MFRTVSHHPLRRSAAVALTLLALSTVPATGAHAVQRHDRQSSTEPALEVPCFIGHHDWAVDLVGPQPTCTL